jgi:hypothetical protein
MVAVIAPTRHWTGISVVRAARQRGQKLTKKEGSSMFGKKKEEKKKAEKVVWTDDNFGIEVTREVLDAAKVISRAIIENFKNLHDGQTLSGSAKGCEFETFVHGILCLTKARGFGIGMFTQKGDDLYSEHGGGSGNGFVSALNMAVSQKGDEPLSMMKVVSEMGSQLIPRVAASEGFKGFAETLLAAIKGGCGCDEVCSDCDCGSKVNSPGNGTFH